MATVFFLSLIVFAHGQNISTREADSLFHLLRKDIPDTSRIAILLQLADYNIKKAGEFKTDLDSAGDFINTALRLNQKVGSAVITGNIYLIQSHLFQERGQRDSARKLAEKAVGVLQNEKAKLILGEAYYSLSEYYDYNVTAEMAERINLVRQAATSFEEGGSRERAGASYQMLGDLYDIKGDYYTSLEYLGHALGSYKAAHHPEVQGIYSLMGRVYIRLRDFKKAVESELLALKAAAAAKDSTLSLCAIDNYLGQAYTALDEKDHALRYYTAALQVAERNKDNQAVYIAVANVADAYTNLKEPVRALKLLSSIGDQYPRPPGLNIDFLVGKSYVSSYCALRQFSKARPYAYQLIGMITKNDLNDNATAQVYAVAIRYFIASGQYDSALAYLKLNQALAEKDGDRLAISNNYKLWFMQDTARRDYTAAVGHLLKYNLTHDSLFNETKSRQIGQLEVEYETEKKDQDIKLLKQQDLVQQIESKQNKLTRNIMIAVAGLLLIIIGLLVNRYTLKQRTNRSLRHLVREKEWLLKEIHHRVKNNFQTVMGLLGTQSGYLKNEAAIAAIANSQHRIHAMSLIHQRLYQTENLSDVYMPDYIHELVNYLSDSFNIDNRIRFDLQLESIKLDLAHCIPLSLILNEAIANAFKYAFPDGKQGTISVSLRALPGDHLLLTIEDNGIGLPAGFNPMEQHSMGVNLIRGLSAELGAEYSISSQNGTRIAISFQTKIESTESV